MRSPGKASWEGTQTLRGHQVRVEKSQFTHGLAAITGFGTVSGENSLGRHETTKWPPQLSLGSSREVAVTWMNPESRTPTEYLS